MAPTSEERREVARKLRVIGADEHAVLIDCIEAAGYRWSAGVPSFARRLADLIEPDDEIVRCGECRYLDRSYAPSMLICHRPMGFEGYAEVVECDYCSYGERGTDGE